MIVKYRTMAIFLTITDLCFLAFYNSANIMLLALWCDSMKPSMQLLFEPVVDALNSLHSNGIEIHTHNSYT